MSYDEGGMDPNWKHPDEINWSANATKVRQQAGEIEQLKQTCDELERRRQTLESMLDVRAPWICDECGKWIKVDEDGCCVTCGADARHREDKP